MPRRHMIGFTLLLLAIAIVGSSMVLRSWAATEQPAVQIAEIQPQLKAIKAWTDQLKGMKVAQLKQVFANIETTETTWKHDDQGGPKLSYDLPTCDVVLYCTEQSVSLVSIDFFPQ